jgi:hypothetical protein
MLKFSNKSVYKSEQWVYINYNLFSFCSWSKSEHFTGLKKGLVPLQSTGLHSSVADPDPGSGIGCLFDPWIRDPG